MIVERAAVSAYVTARGALEIAQQPDPFIMMAGFADAPARVGKRIEILGEVLGECARRGLEKSGREHAEDLGPASEEAGIARCLMQRDERLKQMHVRILPAQ